MRRKLLERWLESRLTPEEIQRIDEAFCLNSAGYDPWGVDPESVKLLVATLKSFYSDYFRVETVGIDRVPPEGRLLVVANHGGQLPIDGMLISLALLLEARPPRFARGMVERWVPSVPWVSTLFSRVGQVLGDHRNCRELLEQDQTVLVFPEGAKGSGKSVFKRYQLQPFGSGFVRLALETRSPILPVAVIGCEETLPSIANIAPLAKLLSAPYFPLLTTLLPLPTKVTLRFGEPLVFTEDVDCPDAVANELVGRVKRSIEAELRQGLKSRGSAIFTRAAR